VVPVSISYEYDPTDILKIPELLAKSRDEKYVKSENEDFVNLLRGIIGTKKRIHIQVNGGMDQEIQEIAASALSQSEKLTQLADQIDLKIWNGYKLWPSNYISFDLLYHTEEHQYCYTPEEKAAFQKRLKEKVDINNPTLLENFLSMYAYPVQNSKKAQNTLN
jgi:hypothetical protein